MGNKFMRKMVTLILAAAMVMTSGMFAFAASSPTTGKVDKISSTGSNGGKKLSVSWHATKKADKYIVTCGSMKKTVTGTSTYFNTKVGQKYKVTVTPVYGSKKGTAKSVLSFARGTSITSVKAAGSKKLTVTWKKQATQTTGYEIFYIKLNDSGISKIESKIVKGAKKTSVTLKGLESGATYRVMIATYKTVKGEQLYGVTSDFELFNTTKTAKVK